MTHDDDFIAQLEDYLEAFDDSTPLSDRVRDAIRAELPSARQVRPRPGLLRIFTMFSNVSAGARLGVAAVATVVVAVVVGALFLNRSGSNVGVPGGQPTAPPSAAASVAPSEATSQPSASAGPLTLKSAPIAACDPTDTNPGLCVAAGTYQLNKSAGAQTWPVTVTVTVPTGWFNWDAAAGVDAVLVDGGPNDRGSTGWGILFATVGDVSRDPCDATKGVIPAAQVDTPQKLAAAMAAWPKFAATAPQPVTVDGHNGLKLQLTSTAAATCKEQGVLWRTPTGGTLDTYPMVGSAAQRATGTFEIVDTGAGLLVVRMTDFPQTSPNELGLGLPADPTRHAADQPELRAILDSVRLTSPNG
jgi:hypothetical protein